MTIKQWMTRKQRLSEQHDISSWPQVDKSALIDQKLEKYEKRENFVRGYFSGLPLKELSVTNQICPRQIERLVNKCLQIHKDGNILGFRALIPYKHQNTYIRLKQISSKITNQRSGKSGALMRLFAEHADIKEEIDMYFLKKTGKVLLHESRISYKSIFKRFINACRNKGIITDYPFNAKYMGYRSLITYLHRLELLHYGEAIKARSGKDANNKLKLGGVEQQMMPVMHPFERVEFDGHNIDIVFVLEIPSPHGGTTNVPVDRVWLLLIIEALTGAILGYHLSFSQEYNSHDVMQCLKKTVVPWKPRKLSLPALKYPAHGGIPSAILEEAQWATFQEFCFDNARAHLSKDVTRILLDLIGCNINAGPINFPERRAVVERFFGLFEENGFHRLPSTLGSDPRDPRRRDPEKMALKYNIRLEHIEDLVEVLIADYNGTPSSRNGFRSPLEQLRFYLSRENTFIPKLDKWKRGKLFMFDFRYERTIRGNIREGKRPYIMVEGARYTSDILSTTPELIGKKLVVYLNPDDPRYGEAYFTDGTELGVLQATGFWGRTAHTLDMRRSINRCRDKQLRHYADNEDGIHTFLDNVKKDALVKKKERHKLITITKAQDATERKAIDNKNGSLENIQQNQERIGQRELDPAVWEQEAFVD